MNKKYWIIIFIIIILVGIIGTYIYFNISNKNNSSNVNNYQANKTSINSNTTTNKTNTQNKDEITKGITEEQISTFSTKIYSSDPARQHNIQLTCNRLNNTIVKKGDTFSFYAILGPSTADKGYQEADILDQNGNKQKGFGGRKLSDKFNTI